MADVAGFRAVGFATDKVALDKVVAPADVESAAERARLAASDPHQVIRLLEPAAAPADVGELFSKWAQDGVLKQDSGRALYRYHQEFTLPELSGRTLVRRGVLCAVRLPSLADGGVKAHLAVRDERVQAHAELMLRLGLHVAPVAAAYRDPALEVDRLFRKAESAAPLLQVKTPDGTWHRLWRCGDAEVMGAVRHLFSPRKLYLLDGHERLAAMQLAGERLAAQAPMPMYAAGNYATMCLFNLEDQALLPSPCHRLVGGGAIPADELLARAAPLFAVTKLAGLAQHPEKVARTLDGWTEPQASFALAFPGQPDLWQLTLLPSVDPREHGLVGHPTVTRLDPPIIEELFLRRVLGEPRTAPEPTLPPAPAPPADAPTRPAAAAPVRGPDELIAGWPIARAHDARSALGALDGGDAWLAILSRPVPMHHVVHVADLGQELPPRSTHFFPPVLGGLAMLRLTADEDLV
ncbi:MAG: DUF1015 domain-containing protein [Kofleriaceae bacterium]